MMKPSIYSLLIRVNRQRRDIMRQAYGKIGLTPIQVSALGCIQDHPGKMQKEIAELIGVSPTVMVGLLRTLEDRGLVECVRKIENRRAVAVSITREGSELLEYIVDYVDRYSALALKGFTDNETEQLWVLLTRILDNTLTSE